MSERVRLQGTQGPGWKKHQPDLITGAQAKRKQTQSNKTSGVGGGGGDAQILFQEQGIGQPFLREAIGKLSPEMVWRPICYLNRMGMIPAYDDEMEYIVAYLM